MSLRRTGLELGVRLSCHVVGVHGAIQLDKLDQVPIGRSTRDVQANRFQLIAVVVVHLETVTVALRNLGLAISLGNNRTRR